MINIISYPNNYIDESIDLGDTLISSEVVKNINIDVSLALDDEYIEVSDGTNTITLLITDECKYEPINVYYFNKNGAQSSFVFFKKNTENLNITDENYQSDSGQPINGQHQFNRYNVGAKTKIKVNTGFIPEENNEIIKQILFSEKLWRFENDIFTPLNIVSKTLEYKTQKNDKLINYTLDLEYAFNEINNI